MKETDITIKSFAHCSNSVVKLQVKSFVIFVIPYFCQVVIPALWKPLLKQTTLKFGPVKAA